MKVKKLMQVDIATCTPDAPIAEAAKIMWENDCGIVPIVEDGALVGILTDRDVCMSALMTGLPLGLIRVREVMTEDVHSVGPDDDVLQAHAMLRDAQVRRLPVVGDENEVLGVLSLNDLVNEAYEGRSKAAAKRQRDAGKTLAAVCEPREIEIDEDDAEEEQLQA